MTARSMPYGFREGLRSNMPRPFDPNIRLSSQSPTPNHRCSSAVSSCSSGGAAAKTDTGRNLSSGGCSDTTQHSGLNIIYDSRQLPSSGPMPERAGSPEHVGIPAQPVQIPMLMSNVAENRERNRKQPPPNRRRVTKSANNTVENYKF